MMFDKMAGMSGTLMDAKDELFETYGKQVVKIPTNRPLKRVDRKDRYFKNGHDQFWTAVDDVIRLHETGQPVLVVLNSVTDTDLFSRLLIEKNIPHNVLNASNAFWEAQIIAGAGQLNAVTVATTMAGRGTDIKLGALMQDNDGCLAFIDMDNLKKVNDVHGHKAGDRALKLIGNLLAKETENETFAACRLGGDEFLIFMPYSDRASVESVIKRIFEGFESAREADCEIKEAALSAGLCMTTKGAMFESDYTKADKALYYVKQNCKGSYFFYEQLLADNKENTNLSADLRNVAKLLKESGSYTGALDLNYREFARIYEFVNNVGDRHNHNCYLVMVTMNTLPEQLADIEEIEKALDCMEQSIRSKIRKVDVCTRYSSMQYLIILFEPQENQIPNVMERIFMHYYELCDRENFKPQYEYIKMTEVK